MRAGVLERGHVFLCSVALKILLFFLFFAITRTTLTFIEAEFWILDLYCHLDIGTKLMHNIE